jgi:hypothetical protein
MPHYVSTLKGPTHTYQKRLFDWHAVFADLARGSPLPTIRAVAEDWAELPEGHHRGQRYAPRHRVWRCGRTQRQSPMFSCEEEALLRFSIEQENVIPNKTAIQRLAITIRERHKATFASASSTRSYHHHEPLFSVSSGILERSKHDLRHSLQRVKVGRRHKRKRGPEVDEARLTVAIQYVDDVHRSVLRNGARFVINANEISPLKRTL